MMDARRELARVVIAAIVGMSTGAVAADEITDPSELRIDSCVLAPVLDGCTPRTGLPLLLRAFPEFEERLARDHAVAFRAWNGVLVGMDSDIELVFFANGTAWMLEYGYDLHRYIGIYRVDQGGRVSIAFASFPGRWHDMTLEWDATVLMLRPVDPTLTGGRSYWPFRSVIGPEEAALVARLEGWL